jgi:hypothetical protein
MAAVWAWAAWGGRARLTMQPRPTSGSQLRLLRVKDVFFIL